MSADQLTPAQQKILKARKLLDEGLTEYFESDKYYTEWVNNRSEIKELEETDDEEGASSSTDAIIAAVETLLRERRSFVQTADILTHVQSQGLKVGGKKVTSNLSSKILQAGKFKSKNNYGWVLNEFYDEAVRALPANTNTAEGTVNAA